jgi:hypothetical protein
VRATAWLAFYFVARPELLDLLRSAEVLLQATRAAVVLCRFFVLAAAFEAARDLLFLDSEPDQSIVGLVLAALSLTVMPCLAWAKRRTADHLHSPTLRTDATETLLCSWLSAALLGGLVLNARADHSGRQRGQVPQPRWRRRGRILLIGRG